jgi:hypothetical protein
MIMVSGEKRGIRFEQLFDSLSDRAFEIVEKLEAQDYMVRVTNLPKHIRTPEDYGMLCLEQFLSLYDRYSSTYH